jgi:hypothetical protein
MIEQQEFIEQIDRTFDVFRNVWLPQIKITSKELTEPSPMTLYQSQDYFLTKLQDGLRRGIHDFKALKARQLGLCLDPNTRVLTADLRWVRIGDVRPGDELVAVDEGAEERLGMKAERTMRTTVVEAVAKTRRLGYRITLDDGRELICSAGHRWLSRNGDVMPRWRNITGHHPGRIKDQGRLRRGDQIRWITKPWDNTVDFEDGWFSGMMDGEGSFAKSERKGTQVCVAQLPGPVFDRMVRYLADRGYNYRVEADASERPSKFGKVPVPKVVLARTSEMFRLMGTCRPTRFAHRRFWEGKSLPGKRIGEGWATIEKIEPLEWQDMIDLQTECKTFIAEGFVSHNSTVCLPLDIFWLYTNPGLQGALIADSGDNVQVFRETISQMLESLPRSFKIPIKSHNRIALVLANGSRLQYMSAGRGRNSSLGRSRALNFVHATEVSSFGDQNGIDSLRASLAQTHPSRLYIFESTALGQNLWYDMCQQAKKDPAQEFFFIGWWMKDTYRFAPDTEQFNHWWGSQPHLSEEEQALGQSVLDQYGHHIGPDQWAWYRWQTEEQGSLESLQREFPSTELEAWVTTGSPYFKARAVSEDVLLARQYARFNAYDISFGNTFGSLTVKQVQNAADADLRVWEEPKPKARYVIGMDVAYGISATNDRTVISVWRCFADKVIQVAEYATAEPETEQATWVLAWLAGCYQDVIINLEINGPGAEVFMKLKHLKAQLQNQVVRDVPRGLNVTRSLDTMRWYLYKRPDTMGAGYAYNWKTSWDNKLAMLSQMRDHYQMGRMLCRSVPLLDEMLTLKQEGDVIQASGRNKDDRVIAAGLAGYAWQEWVRRGMEAERRTHASEMATQDQRERSDKVVDHIIPAYFADRKRDRDAAAWARALSGDV